MAEQQLEQAKADADAKLRLVRQGTLPKLRGDAALSALRSAEAQLESAQAELDRLAVIAPYDGVIDKLDVERGASVDGGTPVATLIALDPIIAVGEVNEGDLAVARIGSTAEVRLVSGGTVEGKVRYVSRSAQRGDTDIRGRGRGGKSGPDRPGRHDGGNRPSRQSRAGDAGSPLGGRAQR